MTLYNIYIDAIHSRHDTCNTQTINYYYSPALKVPRNTGSFTSSASLAQ